MPSRAKRPCRKPGCNVLVVGESYCEKHRREVVRVRDQRRGSSAERGYGYRWQKARRAWLVRHPLCEECLRKGIVTAGTEVDHINPHRGDPVLFWDSTNWQTLCKSCHSRKTQRGE